MLFVSADLNMGTTFTSCQTAGKVLDSKELLIMLVSVRMNDSDLLKIFIIFIDILSKPIPLEFFNLLITLFTFFALTDGRFSIRDVHLFAVLNSAGGRCAVRSFAMAVKNKLKQFAVSWEDVYDWPWYSIELAKLAFLDGNRFFIAFHIALGLSLLSLTALVKYSIFEAIIDSVALFFICL